MTHKPKELRDYANEFSLSPKERAVYGATVTARSLDTGATRTFVRTNETTLDAVRLILDELDLLAGNFRVVSISTPITIRRDIFASRIAVVGKQSGQFGTGLPEEMYLGRLKRPDMLHPSIVRMSERNAA